jgi:hypothetical protein
MIAGQGGLVYRRPPAGQLGQPAMAWAWVFGLMAVVFALGATWHAWALRPAADLPAARRRQRPALWPGFVAVFAAFFPGRGS